MPSLTLACTKYDYRWPTYRRRHPRRSQAPRRGRWRCTPRGRSSLVRVRVRVRARARVRARVREAAAAVHSEGVKRVVDLELELEPRSADVDEAAYMHAHVLVVHTRIRSNTAPPCRMPWPAVKIAFLLLSYDMEGAPMIPMSMACQGSTVAHPAVIETRPARIPLLSAPVVVRTGMTDRTWLTTCANRDLAKGQAGAIGQDTHRGPRCDRVSW